MSCNFVPALRFLFVSHEYKTNLPNIAEEARSLGLILRQQLQGTMSIERPKAALKKPMQHNITVMSIGHTTHEGDETDKNDKNSNNILGVLSHKATYCAPSHLRFPSSCHKREMRLRGSNSLGNQYRNLVPLGVGCATNVLDADFAKYGHRNFIERSGRKPKLQRPKIGRCITTSTARHQSTAWSEGDLAPSHWTH